MTIGDFYFDQVEHTQINTIERHLGETVLNAMEQTV